MEEIFSGCLGFLFRVFTTIVLGFVLNPIFCVIATPVVLVRAFSGPGTYSENVKSDYRRIWNRKIDFSGMWQG